MHRIFLRGIGCVRYDWKMCWGVSGVYVDEGKEAC